jgi:hypothetical protein
MTSGARDVSLKKEVELKGGFAASAGELRHTVPIRGGFTELQKRGLKITDYRTTEKH